MSPEYMPVMNFAITSATSVSIKTEGSSDVHARPVVGAAQANHRLRFSREVIQLSYRGSRTPTGFLLLRVWDLIRRGPKIENTRVRDRDLLHDGVRRYLGIRRARVLEENTTSRAGRLNGIIEPGP